MDYRTRTLGLGALGGFVSALALPIVAPMIVEIARPLAKALLKYGLIGLDRIQTAAARASESLEDLLAEVRAEVEDEMAEHEAEENVMAVSAGPESARMPSPARGSAS